MYIGWKWPLPQRRKYSVEILTSCGSGDWICPAYDFLIIGGMLALGYLWILISRGQTCNPVEQLSHDGNSFPMHGACGRGYAVGPYHPKRLGQFEEPRPWTSQWPPLCHSLIFGMHQNKHSQKRSQDWLYQPVPICPDASWACSVDIFFQNLSLSTGKMDDP